MKNKIKNYVQSLCNKALLASRLTALNTDKGRNKILKRIANNLDKDRKNIKKSNSIDTGNAHKKKLGEAMIDRLTLTDDRITAMCQGISEIIKIPDFLYKNINLKKQKSGIIVGQMRVPLGVIGMIYESRPNVTIDAAALCLKSGNSVILRGGSESIETNKRLMGSIKKSLKGKNNLNLVQLVEITEREAVGNLLKMNKFVDIIIPRGGKSLIERISRESTIPVIKHLDGNCHVYIDKYANMKNAKNIAVNSKVQRLGVCNAMETLLIHKDVPKKITSEIFYTLESHKIEIRGCHNLKKSFKNIVLAKESDWYTEFLGPIVSAKIVKNVDEAIEHIEKYGSNHTDAIVSSNQNAVKKFLSMVNSSSVMVNTSTRFADGFEYGLGAEIGISTDKLHARGPVGVEGLTSLKYIVTSQGKVRN
ncbi:MAG: glutamate-5-semialdehyde dehydrogenase [Pseudomonadota bacterium]|nr:glutamate-5-semialdehyde dehydrogenase [Pseudomonadota bacterium]